MEDFLIVITTCKSYFENVQGLIEQININKFNKKQIIIVSGQEPINETSYIDDVKIVKVKYTGLHHTGAIYICENINEYTEYNYFLLLPDTIKFGANFYQNLQKYYNSLINEKNTPVISLINPRIRPSMDMCIASKTHLIKMYEYLSKIKRENINHNTLVKLKRQLIFDENTILGIGSINKKGTNFKKVIEQKNLKSIINSRQGYTHKLINNGKIQEVYLIALDLYKYQRNFRGPGPKPVLEL